MWSIPDRIFTFCFISVYVVVIELLHCTYQGTASSSPFLAEESSVSPISSSIYSTGLKTNAITSNGAIVASSINTKQPTNSNIRRGPGRPRKPTANSRVVKRTRGGGNSGQLHHQLLQQCHHPLSTPVAAATGQSQLLKTQDNNSNNSFMSNMMLPSPIHEDGSCPFDNDSAITTPNNNSAIVSSSGSGMLAIVSSSNAVAAAAAIDENSEADSKSAAWIREIVLGSDKIQGSEKPSEKVSTGAKVMLPPEELPYFPEKWPGKVCALCCLGERSQLGQGEMLRIELKNGDPKSIVASSSSSSSSSSLSGTGNSGSMHEFLQMSQEEEKSPRSSSNQQTQLSNRRQKGLNKCKYGKATNESRNRRSKLKIIFLLLLLFLRTQTEIRSWHPNTLMN